MLYASNVYQDCTTTEKDKRSARVRTMEEAPDSYRELSELDRRFGYWPGANDDFTGRETELKLIAEQLQGDGARVSVIHDAQDEGAASGIVGFGGVGKTQ